MLKNLLVAAIGFFLTVPAVAKEIPAQGRFFLGTTKVEPDQMNGVLEGEGLKKVDNLSYLGFEITTPILKFLNVGGRYMKKGVRANEDGSTFDTTDHALLNQDSVLLLARATLFSTAIVRIDVFGGVGGSNTSFKIQSGAQNGELTKKASGEGGFSSLLTSYGASVNVGFRWVYLTLEGGIEQNKVSNFTRTGSVSDNFQQLDISGPYFLVGLMLDGLSGSKK